MSLPSPEATQQGASEPTANRSTGQHGRVIRNALFLLVGQAASMPLSILLNAAMARYLGAGDYGYIYLGATLTAFGLLVVEWGQSGTLPALVARAPSKAGTLLGTGIAYRVSASIVVFGAIGFACHLLNYGTRFEIVFALSALGWAIGTISGACQDVVRGFERTDVTAYATFGQQLLNVLLVVPVLLVGGGVISVLSIQSLTPTIALLFVIRSLKKIGIGRIAVERDAFSSLMKMGTPFFMLGLAMNLQPNVDAVLLSKLAPIEVIGWHAAARKLIGLLVYPASALGGALYPTLARLHAEDADAFRATLRTALSTATILVAPLALGCLLYPDLGIRLFSRGAFGHAEDNLRVLSAFILIVYFTIVLGVGLMAAGLQRAWAVAQLVCVVISAVADPILIPWFQTHRGNGGLGVCVAAVLSEVVMLAAGVWLSPRGIFDRTFVKRLALVGVSGGAMGGVAYLLRDINPFAAAPLAVATYVGCLWLSGGIDETQRTMIRTAINRRFKRA